MNKVFRFTIMGVAAVGLLVGWMLLPVKAQAPGGSTLVQQSATMLNAATKFCTTTATINSQVTCTMTPAGGNSIYITNIDLMACQNNTSAAVSNLTFTSTNITGAPIWQVSVAATANLCAPVHSITLPTALKATTPGTAVTIVSPAAQAQTAFTITVAYYEAP